MDLQGSRIAVIGGAGFIGSHLVEQLLREPVSELVVLDNFCRGSRSNLEASVRDRRLRVVEGDITSPRTVESALDGVDAAFHLAALWLLHCQDHPREALKVNVEGTFNVLEACVRKKVKRLVYSSSASVYGDAVEFPMREEHPFHNRTFYGATKLAGEQMCRAFHDRYGLDYVGLRYMNVYGPRQDCHGAYTTVIVKMLDRIDAGEPPIVYGDGSQTYDFVYVTDVAQANVRALGSGKADAFYNVGTGVGVNVRDLAGLLLETTGSSQKIRFEPEGKTFVTRRVGSTEKAKRELGFEATTDLASGLARFVEWWRGSRAPKLTGR